MEAVDTVVVVIILEAAIHDDTNDLVAQLVHSLANTIL